MQQEHTLDYKWEQYIELYLEKFPNMIQIENIQFLHDNKYLEDPKLKYLWFRIRILTILYQTLVLCI